VSWWLIILLVLLLPWLVWIGLFVLGGITCPRCGVELPKDYAYPGKRIYRCPRCGWSG
jgi:hypothetical protein